MVLSRRALRLSLQWRPREENQVADDLTNDKFDGFDSKLRIDISWQQVEKELLDKLLTVQSEYERVISLAKLVKNARPHSLSSFNGLSKAARKASKTVW